MKATLTYNGKYERDSDFIRDWKIETQGESEEEVLKFCLENLYKKDIPSSAEWHANIRYDGKKYNDMSYYFEGYYLLTETKNGYSFTVFEPYKEITYEETLQYLNDVMSSTINYDESLDYQLTSDDLDWVDKARKILKKSYKYRWHDLRKNPEDLPTKEENEYLIAWRRAPYTDIYYEVGNWEFMEGKGYGFHHSHSECMIAWREIEPFEESYHE